MKLLNEMFDFLFILFNFFTSKRHYDGQLSGTCHVPNSLKGNYGNSPSYNCQNTMMAITIQIVLTTLNDRFLDVLLRKTCDTAMKGYLQRSTFQLHKCAVIQAWTRFDVFSSTYDVLSHACKARNPFYSCKSQS